MYQDSVLVTRTGTQAVNTFGNDMALGNPSTTSGRPSSKHRMCRSAGTTQIPQSVRYSQVASLEVQAFLGHIAGSNLSCSYPLFNPHGPSTRYLNHEAFHGARTSEKLSTFWFVLRKPLQSPIPDGYTHGFIGPPTWLSDGRLPKRQGMHPEYPLRGLKRTAMYDFSSLPSPYSVRFARASLQKDGHTGSFRHSFAWVRNTIEP